MVTTRQTLRDLVVPAYVPIILGTVGSGMLIPVLPLYLTDRALSLGSVSLVLAGVGIGSMAGSVPAGEILGRFGERTAMVVSFVAMALATAPLGFTDAVLVLLALRVAFGMASAMLRLSRQTFITRRVETLQRGRALSFVGGSFRVALLIGPFLGGLLVDAIGYRWTFVVAALFAAAGLMPAWWSARSPMPLLPDAARAGERSLGMVAGLRHHWRRLALAGPVPLLVMAVREGRFIVLPLIADDLGLSATEVGGLVTVSTAADLLLFPLAGFLMDRFGRLSAMVPAFSLVILGLVMLAVADSSLAVVMSGIVMGIGNGLGSGTMLTLGSDLAPADAAGPFLAGMSLMQGAGRIVGALLVGLVGDTLGLGAAAMAFAIVMGIAIVWLVGVIGESSDPERIRLRSLRVVEPSCVGKSGGK